MKLDPDFALWSYDLVVIGTGPGGYVCAIRAAQLGLKVAVVEKNKTFGGTCLNIGCIPSKALLAASEKFAEADHALAGFGVIVDKPRLDLKGMMKHKDDTVAANVNGVAFLFKKNKIDTFIGTGEIKKAGVVEVTAEDGARQSLVTKNIVIATGSDVAPLPGLEIDEKQIVSSTGALSLGKVPGKIVIVGAGVIGLELGSVWRRLGAEVLVVEFLDRILGPMDGEVGKQFQRMLEKQGFEFLLGHKVVKADKAGAGIKVTIAPAQGGDEIVRDADIVLVAIGRRPFIAGLGLEAAGVTQTAAASSSTNISPPTCRASMPLAMSCAGRCWRIKPRTRASRSLRSLPASMGTSITRRSPPSSTQCRRSPRSARRKKT